MRLWLLFRHLDRRDARDTHRAHGTTPLSRALTRPCHVLRASGSFPCLLLLRNTTNRPRDANMRGGRDDEAACTGFEVLVNDVSDTPSSRRISSSMQSSGSCTRLACGMLVQSRRARGLAIAPSRERGTHQRVLPSVQEARPSERLYIGYRPLSAGCMYVC